jgi:hypothetical protein
MEEQQGGGWGLVEGAGARSRKCRDTSIASQHMRIHNQDSRLTD